MRDMMWIYAAMIFLVAESRSQNPGSNQTTFMNNTTNDTRHLAFNRGSDICLTCSNKTWNESLYVIWKIKLKSKICTIAFSINGEASKNNCSDGKSLRNTSTSQSYLHIPNFSANDVGDYMCEQAVRAGMETIRINVAFTVPPNTSLEVSDNTRVAVCRAERGKPAANISWSHKGNNSTYMIEEPNGFVTVESHLNLTEDMFTDNLTCIIRHLFWNESKSLTLQLNQTNDASTTSNLRWVTIPLVVVVTALLVGFAVFVRKKLLMLRQCQQSDDSQTKSPPIEDVEEVEPYASYVQRVNSIYN